MSQNQKLTINSKINNCICCNYSCSKLSDYNKHLLTNKHKKNCEEIEIFHKNPSKNLQKSPKYSCNHCNYFTKKLSEFNKHTNTIKHKENINQIVENENTIKYNCKHCEKEYNKKNSCIKHEKICILQNTLMEQPRELSYNDIINRLIQENKELRNFMTEQTQAMTEQTQAMTEQTQAITEQNKEFIKTIADLAKNNNTTIVNGNVNNNNKFNINLFLNEKCKDAMNFADFIKNIEVSHEDLENNAQLGFVNGISKIIIDNLKQLSIYDRPIHCSDIKRETMYIKDENKWEKEEDTKKLKNAIQEVSRKSMISLVEWQDTNPDFQDMDSEFSNKCISMTQQCIAGSNRDVYYPKVIRSLAKEIMIEKNT
jgi:hypothetical protein